MKKTILGLLLIFTASVVFGQTIVVSTFSTRGQTVTADDAESITELFIAELAKQSGVRVVDRTSLDRVVREMRFQNSDWSNSQKTAQLGAALNAEFLVRGQLNQLGQKISVAITALDIKTLEVVSSYTSTFNVDNIFSTGSDGLFRNMWYMASGIAKQIPQQNWLVGKWQSVITDRPNIGALICILELKSDFTIVVERYDFYWGGGYSKIQTGTARGTGFYSTSGRNITINLLLTGSPNINELGSTVSSYDGTSFVWNDARNSFRLIDRREEDTGLKTTLGGGVVVYNQFFRIQ